jgi:hypothetical protein
MATRFLGVVFYTLAVIGAANAEDPIENKPEFDEKSRIYIGGGLAFEIAPNAVAHVVVERVDESDPKTFVQIKDVLRESGLKGERLESATAQIGKIMTGQSEEDASEDDHGKRGNFFTFRKYDGNAIVVGTDGKHRTIKLSRSVDVDRTSRRSESVPVTIQFHADHKNVWEQVEKSLKDAGVNHKHIEMTRKAFEETKDDDARSSVTGTIVVDGEVKEFAFDKGDFQPGNVVWTFAGVNDKYMIGLKCEPADEALRSQWKLDKTGLVVESVFDGTPAKKANVQIYDVLLMANDKKLSKVQDLATAVQESGKDNKILSLTVIRGGERQNIKVTPAERKVVGVEGGNVIVLDGDDGKWRAHLKSISSLDIQKHSQIWGFKTEGIGPGIVRYRSWYSGEADVKSLKKQVEQLQKQLEQLQEDFEKSHAATN